MMEEAFRAILTASSDTGLSADAINFGAHPQGYPLPAIVLMTISDAAGLHMKGTDGLSDGRVQVDCYATSYGETKRLARSVRLLLHGYRGGGFQLIQHVGSNDTREGGSNEADRPFRVSADFLIKWSEDYA